MNPTTKSIIFIPRNIPVTVLDTFECGGKTLVVIKALEGKPFADGAKTTTKTDTRTVSIEELSECTCTPISDLACPVCQCEARKRYGDEIPF
jgi:hypothetical protein